jgi:hypothetical protein
VHISPNHHLHGHSMPSTEHHIVCLAVEWSNVHLPDEIRDEPAEEHTVNEIQAAGVPRPGGHASAVEAVHQETFAGQPEAAQRRYWWEDREMQVEQARLAVIREQAQDVAVADAAANQAHLPPRRTRNKWMKHLRIGLDPSIQYVLSRFSAEGGDHYEQVELYRGARVYDPVYARAITQGKAFELIKKLHLYPPLNKQSIISSLKSSWCVYKTRASLVTSEEIDVVQWH